VLFVVLLQVARPMPPRSSSPTRSIPAGVDVLPIGALTPGAAGTLSAADLCRGHRAPRTSISPALRQAVLRQYRMEDLSPDEYELDYLITPELGGVADARNLWPERYDSAVWTPHVKDDLERVMPQLVCAGAVDLATAQREIAQNWIAAYQKYFKTDRPLPRQAGVADDDDDDDEIRIRRTGTIARAERIVIAPLIGRR
jgi:hypothetical protein